MPWTLKREREPSIADPTLQNPIADGGVDSARPARIELIVGLGNPGSAFAGNRHNVGFRTINRLSRELGIDVGKHTKTASIGEGQFESSRLILAKPRTFMNLSGVAIGELLRRFKLPASQMLLIYDELDLPAGRVRIRESGGHGGQKGMKSIVAAAGTSDFPRIRIGIGRPIVGDKPSWEPEVIAGWVLGDPPTDQRRILDDAVTIAAEAALVCLRDGVTAAMNRFNKG